jgi:hypothetical protein
MFSSINFPVVIGSIIFVAIMVPNVLLWITYRKYKKVAKALPNPQELKLMQSYKLDEKRAGLTARLLDDWANVPSQELAIARHALWTAMLLEAASDSSIDHREMKFVADLFGQMAGSEMDFRPVINATELVQSDQKTAFSEISKAGTVSDATKKQIMAGAFLVSVSDHALLPQETDCLMRIADALAINRRDRKAMLEEITARFDA